MCRLLAVRSKKEFEISAYLKKFASISKNSKEYQGHGWGMAALKNNEWDIYRNIKPVWEDDLDQFGKTNFLIVHARSAFQDEGIVVENNMPFFDGKHLFIFNGELKGVRLSEKGRIGAEKIFNFIKRFQKYSIKEAIKKGTSIIKEKSKYVRAMNLIINDKDKIYLYTFFNEDPEYFTMHMKTEDDRVVICSDPLDEEGSWKKIENDSIKVF